MQRATRRLAVTAHGNHRCVTAFIWSQLVGLTQINAFVAAPKPLAFHSCSRQLARAPKAAVGVEALGRVAGPWQQSTSRLLATATAAPTSTTTTEVPLVDFYSVAASDSIEFGDYKLIQSNGRTAKQYAPLHAIGNVDGPKIGENVWIRGRVHNVRGKGKSCFLVIRAEGATTLQACHFRDGANAAASDKLLAYLQALPLESVVDIYGQVKSADVKSCSQKNAEIHVRKAFVVSRAPVNLPFLMEHATKSERQIEESLKTDKPLSHVPQDTRLDTRWLDLRVPANNAIMRTQSAVCSLFRTALNKKGFVEIHTPKLIAGQSEGGSDVFKTDYFGTPACLAQSPQLYKQMAISGDLERVFEIGPVFRAEKSHTRRHLCEFTGLDLEMSIQEHYSEVLDVVHDAFKHIFDGLEAQYGQHLAVVREQYPSEPVLITEKPCIVHYQDAVEMLRERGHQLEEFADLTSAQEVALGEIIKQKYNTDFFILDQYPSAVRPFYTMPAPHDSRYSNSYDIFLRGQEICSGAQRIHDADMLVDSIKQKGIPLEPLQHYVSAFRHGCKPHGGAGFGLERVVALYLGLDNVRKASMFPRDPNRIEP